MCVCVCVCCHPMYSGRKACGRTSWSHIGFLHLRSTRVQGLIFFSREGFSRLFPSSNVKSIFFCMFVCVVIPFILDVRRVDVQARVTQEEGHTGFLSLPSAVLALIFITRRIQRSLSLVDRISTN